MTSLDITDEQRERELREWTTPGTAKSRNILGAEDYRALLRLLDKERDTINSVKELEPYVDGGLISWELIKKAVS